MADDLSITPGSGTTIATDEVASRHGRAGHAPPVAGNVRDAAPALEHRTRGLS